MTLGEKVRHARIERGMTQKQLVGEHITRNMLSKIENDSATPSMRTLEFLARQLDLPTSYFMSDFSLSDGKSPDGLDDMRDAYREGRYLDCLAMLEESKTAGSTDEGYLLHALADIGAAKEALAQGDTARVKEHADSADYYNKQGLYYSAGIDAEMSLILAECALLLDISEFERNARDYESAVEKISFAGRYNLCRAEYLVRSGETELAKKLLDAMTDIPKALEAKRLYVYGLYHIATGSGETAVDELKKAEELSDSDTQRRLIYKELEQCCLKAEDYKGAYFYAAKQRESE